MDKLHEAGMSYRDMEDYFQISYMSIYNKLKRWRAAKGKGKGK